VYIAVLMASQWRSLLTIIGREELLDDPTLDTTLKRFEERERVDPLVVDWMKEHTVEEVVATMDAGRIRCGVYHTKGEVASNPHVQAREMLVSCDFEHPGLEAVPISGVPIKLSKTPGTAERRAPRVGEHLEPFGDVGKIADAAVCNEA
jgi:crotonobetainyl-CoA:carnitine CoA-transferase CaiB-like acyl-CoA transferase